MNSPPNSTSCQNGLIATSTGKMLMNAAPMTWPSVGLIPAQDHHHATFTATGPLNWPGETIPWNENTQPAAPAIAADRPNMQILTRAVRAPAAAANGSASLIASSTG